MKKIVSSVLLASVLFTALPVKKAEAGLILSVNAMAVTNIACPGIRCYSLAADIGSMTVILGSALGGLAATVVTGNPLFFVLNSQSNEEEKLGLDQVFEQAYPFIQDEEVTKQLGKLAQKKANGSAFVDEKIEIKFSLEEIQDILAPTDLMETYPVEVENMIMELT